MRCLSTQVPRNEYPKLVATTHLIRLIKVVRGLKRCAWTSQITSRDNPRQRFSMVRSRCSPFLNRRHACPWRCNTIRSRNQHPCTLPFSASQTLNPINCALGFLHVYTFLHRSKFNSFTKNDNVFTGILTDIFQISPTFKIDVLFMFLIYTCSH